MSLIFAHLTDTDLEALYTANVPRSAVGTWRTCGRYLATTQDQLTAAVQALGWAKYEIKHEDGGQMVISRIVDRRPAATRAEVYAAIDGERAYQDARWNAKTTASEGWHSPEEWLLYIRRYIGVAEEILATRSVQDAYPEVQHVFRKMAAMCVCEMEQLGAPPR